jgi:hypothetical protein
MSLLSKERAAFDARFSCKELLTQTHKRRRLEYLCRNRKSGCTLCAPSHIRFKGGQSLEKSGSSARSASSEPHFKTQSPGVPHCDLFGRLLAQSASTLGKIFSYLEVSRVCLSLPRLTAKGAVRYNFPVPTGLFPFRPEQNAKMTVLYQSGSLGELFG